MKYTAKQINPCYQDNSLEMEWIIDDMRNNETLAISGNRHYKDYTFPLFDQVKTFVEGVCENLFDYYSSMGIEAVNREIVYDHFGEYLQIDHIIKLTDEECEKVVEYGMSGKYDSKTICAVLTIVTHKVWDYQTICGGYQGEWNILYFDSSWNERAREKVETIYFNQGSEWIITDEDEDENLYCYCTSWRDEDIIKELRENICSGDELQVYFWAGEKKIDVYREAN